MARLGRKQRAVLEWARGTIYIDGKRHIPACITNISDDIGGLFVYESEFERFVRDLEERGWVRIERRWFVYLTDAGEAALTAQQAAR